MATVRTIDLEAKAKEIAEANEKGERAGAIELASGVRMSLRQGCTLPNCNCSPGNWISISNGKILLSVDLTDEEAEAVRQGWLDSFGGI